MKLKMFSVYDKQATFYSPPFFAKTDSEAMRMVRDATQNGADSILRSHPTDFALYLLGTFDDSTGSFSSVDIPVCLLGNFIFTEVIADADTQSL